MHRILTAGLLAILVAGCAGQRGPLIVADEAAVTGCRFIGTFSDRKLDAPLTGGDGPQVARNSVQVEARDAGATHIVWLPDEARDGVFEAKAAAYICP